MTAHKRTVRNPTPYPVGYWLITVAVVLVGLWVWQEGLHRR